MNRRTLVAVLAGGPLTGLAAALVGEAEPKAKVSRLAVLLPAERETGDPSVAAFRQGLRDLGYVEGQTVLLDLRHGHGKPEQFPALLAEMIRSHVDVLVVGSGPGARAAKKATQTIPVVFVGVGDPVGNKLVASLARPGGNVTGLSFAFEDGFAGKWVELLKETLADPPRVTLLHDPGALLAATFVRDAQKAAQTLGLTLRVATVRHQGDLEAAFATTARGRSEAIIVSSSVFFHAHLQRLVELGREHRVAVMYPSREFVDGGGLMSYGVSMPSLWRRAATYVDRILRGEKPANLPVEQPTKFELVINLKTAQALGVAVPQSLLLRADEVLP
jgi:putative ABC transport system substrate-binding protein